MAAALHFDSPEAPPAKRRSFEFGLPARDLHKPQTSGRSTVLNATENILRNAQPQHGVPDPKLPSDTSSTAAAEPSLGASSVYSGRHAIQGGTSAGAKASVLADPPVLRNPTSSSSTPALRTPVLDHNLRQPTSFVTKSDKPTNNASGIISSCGKRPSAAAGSSNDNLRPNLQQPVMNRTLTNAAPSVLRNAVNSYSASALSRCTGPSTVQPVPFDNAPPRLSSRPDSNVEDCESMFDYGEDEDDLLLSSACEASEAVVSGGQSRNNGDSAVHMIGNVSNPLNNPSVSRYQTPCPGQSSYRDKHPGRDSPSAAPSRVGACSEWDSPVAGSSKDSGSEDTPRQRGMKRKRKFPGPAGLLPSMVGLGNLCETFIRHENVEILTWFQVKYLKSVKNLDLMERFLKLFNHIYNLKKKVLLFSCLIHLIVRLSYTQNKMIRPTQ